MLNPLNYISFTGTSICGVSGSRFPLRTIPQPWLTALLPSGDAAHLAAASLNMFKKGGAGLNLFGRLTQWMLVSLRDVGFGPCCLLKSVCGGAFLKLLASPEHQLRIISTASWCRRRYFTPAPRKAKRQTGTLTLLTYALMQRGNWYVVNNHAPKPWL